MKNICIPINIVTLRYIKLSLVCNTQVALELLEILFSSKEIHQNENKSKRIRQQLQNQTVAVSVLGRHGVGKSTMLDALLGERWRLIVIEERKKSL